MHVCMLHILIWCWASFLAVNVFLRICGESFVLLIPVLICALWEGHRLLLLRDPYKCLTCFYMFFFTSLAKTLWIMNYDANNQCFLSFQFSSSVQLISLPMGGHEAAEDADTMTVDLPHAHVCWKHYNGLQAGHEFFRSFNVCIHAGKACPTSEVKTNK